MIFAIVLGAIIGAACMTLLGQWARGTLVLDHAHPVITPAAFPRLAPSERVPRYSPRFWHRAA